jgi:hypothetical protein
VDKIGNINHKHLLFMLVMDKLDMVVKAKNHVGPENIQKQGKSYSRLIHVRNKSRFNSI